MKLAKAISLIIFCTILTAVAQILMKLGLNRLQLSFVGVITNFFLILGVLLYVLGAIIMILAFKNAELSVLYPFFSLSFIWVTLLSFLFLKESLSLVHGLGVLLIILGVSFVGRSAL